MAAVPNTGTNPIVEITVRGPMVRIPIQNPNFTKYFHIFLYGFYKLTKIFLGCRNLKPLYEIQRSNSQINNVERSK